MLQPCVRDERNVELQILNVELLRALGIVVESPQPAKTDFSFQSK